MPANNRNRSTIVESSEIDNQAEFGIRRNASSRGRQRGRPAIADIDDSRYELIAFAIVPDGRGSLPGSH